MSSHPTPTYPAPPPTVTFQTPLQNTPQSFPFQHGSFPMFFVPIQPPKPHLTHHRLPPGDPSSVTSQIASKAVHRLISTQLRSTGYDSAQPQALRRLELEVVACKSAIAMLFDFLITLFRLVVEALYRRAHEYANLANRAGPIATDLLLASAECGLQTKDLHKVGAKSSRKRKRGTHYELTYNS